MKCEWINENIHMKGTEIHLISNRIFALTAWACEEQFSLQVSIVKLLMKAFFIGPGSLTYVVKKVALN